MQDHPAKWRRIGDLPKPSTQAKARLAKIMKASI
jgi:hypothetical protein